MPTAYWAGRLSSLIDFLCAEKPGGGPRDVAGRAFDILEEYTIGWEARESLQVCSTS